MDILQDHAVESSPCYCMWQLKEQFSILGITCIRSLAVSLIRRLIRLKSLRRAKKNSPSHNLSEQANKHISKNVTLCWMYSSLFRAHVNAQCWFWTRLCISSLMSFLGSDSLRLLLLSCHTSSSSPLGVSNVLLLLSIFLLFLLLLSPFRPPPVSYFSSSSTFLPLILCLNRLLLLSLLYIFPSLPF